VSFVIFRAVTDLKVAPQSSGEDWKFDDFVQLRCTKSSNFHAYHMQLDGGATENMPIVPANWAKMQVFHDKYHL
jgi:hypothetical protein